MATNPEDTAFSNDRYSLTKRELFAAMALQGAVYATNNKC